MKTALLLIDIQNDYFPGGKMELEGPVEAAQKANELLQCFRDHSMPTVHIQHVSLSPDASFFIPGDRGTDINDITVHYEGEALVQKHYPQGIHAVIAEALRKQLGDQVMVRTATLDEPEHGLTQAVLDATDVLLWWGHAAHARVSDEVTHRVHQRVLLIGIVAA